jgi:hypothetical protein
MIHPNPPPVPQRETGEGMEESRNDHLSVVREAQLWETCQVYG